MRNRLLKIGFLGALLLGLSMTTYAQRAGEKQADKEFEKYAYIDAIKVYERIANKGYISTSTLTKLGDAYYFNGKLAEANKWYEQLFNAEYADKDLSALPSEYYYRFAQTQKAVGNLVGYDKNLEEFARLEQNDSRAKLYNSTKGTYLADIASMENRFDINNISVNTKYSDYGATVYNNALVYTSARLLDAGGNKIHDWTNEKFTSIFQSEMNEDGTFGKPVLLSKQLNSKTINGSTAVFTKDGNTMFFTRNNSSLKGERKINNENTSLLKIFKASKQEDGTWGDIKELPFNSDNYNCAHPALSTDEKYLYFASDKDGTLGQSDIFRVAIYFEDKYGAVENVGDKINTSGRETFPFISSDNILYFSSDGRPGLGGLDVYMVKMNTDGSFGPVLNMAEPINSANDDFAFYIDSKSNKGFVSSNRAGGKGGDDIYSFSQKVCKQVLDGIVYDIKTNEVLANATVSIYDSNYAFIQKITTNEKGYYRVEGLDCGVKVRIKAEAVKYNTVESAVELGFGSNVNTHNIGLEKKVIELTVNDDLFKKLNLDPIYFDFDKSNIRPDAALELAKIVEVMKEYPTMKIDARSHTDSRGNDDYNMKLSDRRAKSTVAWIISQGIESSRITGSGYGESQLQNKCKNGVPCTVEEHQMNRRSEFIIIAM